MAHTKWKRKKLLIDKEFQFRYLMTWVVLTMSLLLGLVTGSIMVYAYLGQKAYIMPYFIGVNAVAAVVITGCSMYYIVIHSHRIAGPAYRLDKLLRDAAEGRRGFRVRLRKKDYLKHIAASLNEFLESLERKEERIHKIGVMVGEMDQGDRDTAGKLSRELKDLCPAISEVMDDGAQAAEAKEPEEVTAEA